ncbi:cobalamin biosynthesis protein CobT [Pararhizobium sp. A13]|uniref:cobaltochelatase CobT-related protein n=1 Tax=Pararhizobium sp. A13 TaxID=3133975 RepID=UPI00311ACE83
MSYFFKKLSGFFISGQETKKVEQNNLGYHVFTREFDVVVHSYELDSILGRLPANKKNDYFEAWHTFENALQKWRIKAHIAGLEASCEIRAEKSPEALENTLVTILVDHSGSMAGQSILLTAATCDVTMDFLSLLGVQYEVLGFTTVGWKGGKSRELWERQNRPAAPGRLADTLHIIYKSAKLPGRPVKTELLKPMLRRDLLKENIDGEAIEWAISRQMETSAGKRIILVLSDGVPADDSTLLANDRDFLNRHLSEVIARTQQEGAIELVGVGIGFAASQFYSNSVIVKDVGDLGITVIDTLSRVIRG